MKTRLAFIAGAGVGYVLGARAGRKSYEQIKTQATNLWNNPKVQDGVQKATDTISEKAPVVAEKAKEAAAAGAEKAKDAASTGADKAKAKTEEVKENRAEAKAEKEATKAKHKAPEDVVSDPATAIEDEGPATTA